MLIYISRRVKLEQNKTPYYNIIVVCSGNGSFFCRIHDNAHVCTAPGVKLGLSNIVVMYCMAFMGFPAAAQLTLLKGFFAFLTRGATAGFLATMGGMFSIIIMFVLMKLLKDKVNYYTLSVFGALFHNIGQLTGVSLIFGTAFAMGYFPVLAVSAVIMGLVTGAVLTVVIPALNKIR